MSSKHIVSNEDQLHSLIEKMYDLDLSKPYLIEVKQVKSKRSISQNSTFWMWCEEVARETGNDKDDVAEAWYQMFVPANLKEVFGTMICERRTSDKNSSEMAEILTRIQAWCIQEGYVITDPIPDHVRKF